MKTLSVTENPGKSGIGQVRRSGIIARYLIREALGLIFMGVALFWPAGNLAWWPGWAVLAVMTAWTTATAIWIIRFNPNLLAERLGPRRGAKTWDTAIMSMVGIIQLGRYIVAGLDARYSWTGGFPFPVQIIALTICIVGYALVVWATTANTFFSQIVRIQSERDHQVVTTGPYKYVRHPAYAGAILFELAAPVLLASWGALAISGISTFLLFLRTTLEDRTLQDELPGYSEYTRQTRYRLVPGLW